ncbi:MAG: D-alanine--D-alanine ligase family protein [Acidobacteriota bacterium]
MTKKVTLIHNTSDPTLPESAAEEGVMETVEAVEQVLGRQGQSVSRLPLTTPLSAAAAALEQLPKGSLVFNLFEGFPGDPSSEVQVGLLIKALALRATGCPPMAMHLGLHKPLAKRLLAAEGIPTAAGLHVRRIEEVPEPLPFPFPVFLKPAANDASHGIGPSSVVRDRVSLVERLDVLLDRFPQGVLVESFLAGRELNCSVVETAEGPRPLPPSLVDYSALPPGYPPVLTFEAKWAPESPVYQQTPTLCPAPVEPALFNRAQQLALLSYRALGCRGYARVDLREDGDGSLCVLEVNPNPDLAPSAGLAKQARAAGWDYTRLVSTILGSAEKGEPWTFE